MACLVHLDDVRMPRLCPVRAMVCLFRPALSRPHLDRTARSNPRGQRGGDLRWVLRHTGIPSDCKQVSAAGGAGDRAVNDQHDYTAGAKNATFCAIYT